MTEMEKLQDELDTYEALVAEIAEIVDDEESDPEDRLEEIGRLLGTELEP